MAFLRQTSLSEGFKLLKGTNWIGHVKQNLYFLGNKSQEE